MDGRDKPDGHSGREVHVRGPGQAVVEGVKGVLIPACILLAAVFLALPALAGDKYHLLAGSEWDTRGQSFSYAGGGVVRPVKRYENVSASGNIFAGYLKYKFDSDGTTLAAEMPIVTPSVGLKYDGDGYTIGGSAGVDFRRPEKEQAGGGTETSTETGVSAQVEAYWWLREKKSIGVIVSYSTIDEFFWARARGKKGVYKTGGGKDLFAGVELIAMGNSDFSATQAGGFIEVVSPSGEFSVLLKAGFKNSSAFNTGGYGGVEFYKGF